jgi:hypothetical protein
MADRSAKKMPTVMLTTAGKEYKLVPWSRERSTLDLTANVFCLYLQFQEFNLRGLYTVRKV